MRRLAPLLLLFRLAAPQPARAQETPPAAPRPAVAIELRALADSVVAHQTAWIEVRITNNTKAPITIPFRAGKIPAEWKFTTPEGIVLVDWPTKDDMKDAGTVTIGAGELMYEVMSPESSYGVLTNPGTVLVSCRFGRFESAPIALSRRTARNNEKSALRALGPLHVSGAREKAKIELWSLCGRGNDYFDCDEALFTVAWDRMLVATDEAQAIVDSLIARTPQSGWCRPALFTLVSNLPESAGRRYLETIIARKPGGVAEAYALELTRRAQYRQTPFARKKK